TDSLGGLAVAGELGLEGRDLLPSYEMAALSNPPDSRPELLHELRVGTVRGRERDPLSVAAPPRKLHPIRLYVAVVREDLGVFLSAQGHVAPAVMRIRWAWRGQPFGHKLEDLSSARLRPRG